MCQVLLLEWTLGPITLAAGGAHHPLGFWLEHTDSAATKLPEKDPKSQILRD